MSIQAQIDRKSEKIEKLWESRKSEFSKLDETKYWILNKKLQKAKKELQALIDKKFSLKHLNIAERLRSISEVSEFTESKKISFSRQREVFGFVLTRLEFCIKNNCVVITASHSECCREVVYEEYRMPFALVEKLLRRDGILKFSNL